MNGKIAIAYIHDGKTLHPEFVRSLDRFKNYDAEHRKLIDLRSPVTVSGSFLENNRNGTVKGLLDTLDDEWMLSLDTDIGFEPDLPYKLLDAADPVERPIISGMYVGYLKVGLWPVWFKRHGDAYRQLMLKDINPEAQLMPIDAAGMGFCIIHRSVFEKIREVRLASSSTRIRCDPWIWFGRDLVRCEDGTWERLSEDLTFFRRVERAGFRGKVFGHCEVGVDHYKTRAENIKTVVERIDLMNLHANEVQS